MVQINKHPRVVQDLIEKVTRWDQDFSEEPLGTYWSYQLFVQE